MRQNLSRTRAMPLAAALLLAVLPAPAAAQGAQDLPDLVMMELLPMPGLPREGEVVVLRATVQNLAERDAGAFDVGFSVDGQVFARIHLWGLTAGTWTTVDALWNATAGNHTLRAVADVAASVPERSEENNAREATVSVAGTPRPDLAAETFELTPEAPDEGDEVGFMALVRNEGAASAEDFVVRFLVDGIPLGDVPVPGLSAGAAVEVASPPWEAARGSHRAVVLVDAERHVAERDEADNERTLAFDVQPMPEPPRPLLRLVLPPEPRPDLVLFRTVLEPNAPADGEDVTFLVRVANRGDAAAGPFAVTFWVDGATVGRTRVDGLAAGETMEVASPVWKADHGKHAVRAEADADAEVREEREDNNAHTRGFHVRAHGEGPGEHPARPGPKPEAPPQRPPPEPPRERPPQSQAPVHAEAEVEAGGDEPASAAVTVTLGPLGSAFAAVGAPTLTAIALFAAAGAAAVLLRARP